MIKAMLVGNLGKDPQIRTFDNETSVASFDIATEDDFTDPETGRNGKQTNWHRIVVRSKGLVDVVMRYLHKGSKVYVEGDVRVRKWTDQRTNEERSITEIIVATGNHRLTMLDKMGDQQPRPVISGSPPPPAHDGDDIPF